MSEEEVVEIMESNISLNHILNSKSIEISVIQEFIEKTEHEKEATLIYYGHVECLFMLGLIEEKVFMEMSKTISNLLKEVKTDEN